MVQSSITFEFLFADWETQIRVEEGLVEEEAIIEKVLEQIEEGIDADIDEPQSVIVAG